MSNNDKNQPTLAAAAPKPMPAPAPAPKDQAHAANPPVQEPNASGHATVSPNAPAQTNGGKK